MPLNQREGGLLVAIPSDFLAEELLLAAEENDYAGAIGPWVYAPCNFCSARGGRLKTQCTVLVVDISFGTESAAALLEAVEMKPKGLKLLGQVEPSHALVDCCTSM